ncbi:MAG: benzoate-CoA ligase family protein [Burkholderiales bacterium]|nr:benzoate-CoA ligase family protein [Burkholderiales bacterium]
MATAHVDTFARDHLPPPEALPEILLDQPFLQFPARLNCATELLDRHVTEGRGDRTCLRTPDGQRWSYAELQDRANRIARVLVHEMGLVPGNRVLLRAPNNPMMAACWFGVVKAGGIAVGSMPLLRAAELRQIVDKARISHALCDLRLIDELRTAAADCPTLKQLRCFHDDSPDGLEAAMARHDGRFANVDTAADDICLIAFTSGTTGTPKGTMHFHRDVMAACACWPPHVLRANADDVFIGSPPLAFTFGLGGLLHFPMSVGASAVLVERVSPPELLDAVLKTGATVMFTAPTSYRAMAMALQGAKLPPNKLRKCVSAGEALPAATRALWREASGLEIIDGIGSTELLHIFISADEHEARPGATGKVVPGYVACIMDADGRPLPPGEVGALAVKGPTGCKYLADPRQANYVKGGWNYTGDAYRLDADGYFHYQSRTDDLIVSAGYNIGGLEVEEVLLRHPAVAECGVVGVPDDERGQIVKAFVVLKPGHAADAAMVRTLQEHVKQAIAPYKYPRAVEFRAALPRTETGKLQRFRLRSGG